MQNDSFSGFSQVAALLVSEAVNPKNSKTKGDLLRTAISRQYYNMFHLCARIVANQLVGRSPVFNAAWEDVYRGLEHGFLKSACKEIASDDFWHEGLRGFVKTVVEFQDLRHRADYDPTFQPSFEDVAVAFAKASEGYLAFTRCCKEEPSLLKHFAVRLVINAKGTQLARQQRKVERENFRKAEKRRKEEDRKKKEDK